jgi:serine/threonine protein kinase/Tol biopolymer transport system component
VSLSPGARVGSYEVLSPLGAGGMGEVYRAIDPRLGREVAIKVLPSEMAADASRLKRFEKEARAASALNHPNIVTIYEIGTSGTISYIAMERVEGKTLRELLFAGALPVKRLVGIAAQIADGLARAHEAGIVHRDLKPENVMVTKDGLVKILDFGLAKQTAPAASGEGSHMPTETGTSPGVVLGTVGYMSPEQAAGQPVDFRSDQFSFGSILYELATGKRAFQKSTAVDTLSAILHDEPKPVGEINPQAPAPLRWVVERCLAKEPERRYAATRDLARDLETLRDRSSEAVSGSVVARPAPRLARWLLALAALLLVGSFLLGKLGSQRSLPSLPRFQRLTFRSGFLEQARFSADGRTVLYSARWDGEPPHIFLTRPESPESQRLDIPDAGLMSVSARGELAVLTGQMPLAEGIWFAGGTLATVPLAGGAPREIAEDVRFADWAPDGKRLITVQENRLLLSGKVIHQGLLVLPRFSPSGDKIAFIEGNRVHVTDLTGKEQAASRKGTSPWATRSVVWSPSGEEVWFTVIEQAVSTLKAMNLAGKERELLRMPRAVTVEDVSRDGRVLLAVRHGRREVWVGSANSARERNLTIFGQSNAMGLSADGRVLLDNENSGFYLRYADGSQPKKLGEGFASELSPDGRWVVVVRQGPPSQLVLIPTGAGEERALERGNLENHDPANVRWSGDGRRLLFGAQGKGHSERLYVQDISGGGPRPVTADGVHTESSSISPDGRFVVVEMKGGFFLCPVEGGQERKLQGLLPTDFVWRNWSEDGRFLYAWDPKKLPFEVFRVTLSSGQREPWKTIAPQDPAGIYMGDLMITPDGKSYAYNCLRDLSDLYLVEGLK